MSPKRPLDRAVLGISQNKGYLADPIPHARDDELARRADEDGFR